MKDLFGNDISPPSPKGKGRLAERLHKYMIAVHGKHDNKCGNCKHLWVKCGSGSWFKCSKATLKGGLSTDWRCKWSACGLFEENSNDNNGT